MYVYKCTCVCSCFVCMCIFVWLCLLCTCAVYIVLLWVVCVWCTMCDLQLMLGAKRACTPTLYKHTVHCTVHTEYHTPHTLCTAINTYSILTVNLTQHNTLRPQTSHPIPYHTPYTTYHINLTIHMYLST